MAPLSNALRSMLERAIIGAREIAEEEAKSALFRLAVDRNEPFASLNVEQRRGVYVTHSVLKRDS